jgi:hypothetical protein
MKLPTGIKLSIQREGNALVLRPITPEFIDSLIGGHFRCRPGARSRPPG